jgi:HEPN domain-containing protein
MRSEASNWWKQALKDLETASKNLEIEEYYVTAFFSQQATEKALKALYLDKLRESSGPTHSLIFLGKNVGIPEEFYSSLRKLSPDFIITRYPDAANGVPYDLYDEEIAEERLKLSQKVLKWVKKELEK